MSNFDKFNKNLNAVFVNLSQVLEIESRSEFFIADYKGQSHLILNTDKTNNSCKIKINKIEQTIEDFEITKTFFVSNAKIIAFIPVDGKFGLLGYGDSYCDCIIFDANDLCFIEFKLNATSLEIRAVRKNREKAISQLGNTIKLFDKKLSGNYSGLHLEAYICTPDIYPRENASWEVLRVSFLEKYGIELFEKVEKRCN